MDRVIRSVCFLLLGEFGMGKEAVAALVEFGELFGGENQQQNHAHAVADISDQPAWA